MDWLSLALAALKVVGWLMDQYKTKQAFDAGREAEVLSQTKAIMAMTEQGKRIVEKIDAMDDSDLDDLERDLTRSDPKSS
jgi:hypothetical protein